MARHRSRPLAGSRHREGGDRPGHAVVATGRNTGTVKKALGEHTGLLVTELDVTSPTSALTATTAAVERFRRIDVLVNNAGNFYAGYFEELTAEQVDAQLAVTLLGPMNVTRAVLPLMRMQHCGHIVDYFHDSSCLGTTYSSATQRPRTT
jgi:NAD(P)-dependent dehydrogenase (short-subunit alcohol dehydrogenase family)